MKRTIPYLFGLLLLATACNTPERPSDDMTADSTMGDTLNALTSAESDSGWHLLFNGEDLSGWQAYHADSISNKWGVDDNAIHYAPDTTQGGTEGDIVSEDSYGNFELTFDWKIDSCGNSGVIYLADISDDHEQPWQTGPEYQILDNTCNPDAKEGDDRTAASAYDVIGAKPDVTKPAGEWNHGRIIVDHGHVEHWLNGTKVVEYELGSDAWKQKVANSKWTEYPDYGTTTEGHISLQDHGFNVWYRNIKIREL